VSHIERALEVTYRDGDEGIVAGRNVVPRPLPPSRTVWPAEQVEEPDWFEFREIIWLLVRRRWQILAVMALVVAPAAAYTIFAERLYRSVAVVQVDPEPVQVLPYREIDQPSLAFAVFMRSQEQILRGSALMSRVAERLVADPDEKVRAEVPNLGGRYALQRLEDTQLFRLGYVAPIPSSPQGLRMSSRKSTSSSISR